MSTIAPAVDVRERHTPAATQWMRNVWTLTRRNFIHVRREPAQLSDATVQPVLFTVLFVYIFGSAMHIAGGAATRTSPSAASSS